MRIVLHGQQAFGQAVLERLLERGENVVAVCCAPTKEGKPEDPLVELAREKGLPVHPPRAGLWSPFFSASSRRAPPSIGAPSRCRCRGTRSRTRQSAPCSLYSACCSPSTWRSRRSRPRPRPSSRRARVGPSLGASHLCVDARLLQRCIRRPGMSWV